MPKLEINTKKSERASPEGATEITPTPTLESSSSSPILSALDVPSSDFPHNPQLPFSPLPTVPEAQTETSSIETAPVNPVDVLPKAGTQCHVIYDYEATKEDEITIKPGDVIVVITSQPGGWWKVRASCGCLFSNPS